MSPPGVKHFLLGVDHLWNKKHGNETQQYLWIGNGGLLFNEGLLELQTLGAGRRSSVFVRVREEV